MVEDRRRALLKYLVATPALVPGCQAFEDEESVPPAGTTTNTERKTTTDSRNNQDHETNIEIIEPQNIEYVPVVEDGDAEPSARLRTTIRDQDGLENIQIFLENGMQSQPQQIAEEQPNGTTELTTTPPFPPTLIAPGRNYFTAEITDSNGNTQNFRTQPITINSNGYRIDFKNSDGENIGNHSTERTWDNFHFNQQRLNQQRQEWLEDAAYNGSSNDRNLINILEQNERELSGDRIGTRYPNWNDQTYGQWNLNSFQEERNFQNIMSWVQSPTRVWQQIVDGGAPSTENDKFAATWELVIERLHPLFNGEEENYDIRAGYVSTFGYGEAGNHGVGHVYADTPNMEEINGQNLDHIDVDEEIRWWVVDTTTDEISPAWESSYREGGPRGRETTGQYNPIARGYESGAEIDALDYSEKKKKPQLKQ